MSRANAEPTRRRDRILLVGDAPLFETWIRHELQRHQLHVETFNERALRPAALSDGHMPDLILRVADDIEQALALKGPGDGLFGQLACSEIPAVLVVFEETRDDPRSHVEAPGWDLCIVMDTSFDVELLLSEIDHLVDITDDDGQDRGVLVEPPDPPPPVRALPSPRRVLVAGDAPLFMSWIRDELERYLIEVEVVQDAAHARAAALRTPPAAVLLVALCDDVPSISAAAVANELKSDEATREIPIVCVMPPAATSIRRQQLASRADGCVGAPYSATAIVRELDRFIGFTPARDGELSLDAETARDMAMFSPTHGRRDHTLGGHYGVDHVAPPALAAVSDAPALAPVALSRVPTPAPMPLFATPALAPEDIDTDTDTDRDDDYDHNHDDRTQVVQRDVVMRRRLAGVSFPVGDAALNVARTELAVCRRELRDRERRIQEIGQRLIKAEWRLVVAQKHTSDARRSCDVTAPSIDERQQSFPGMATQQPPHARGRWLASVMASSPEAREAMTHAPDEQRAAVRATGS